MSTFHNLYLLSITDGVGDLQWESATNPTEQRVRTWAAYYIYVVSLTWMVVVYSILALVVP